MSVPLGAPAASRFVLPLPYWIAGVPPDLFCVLHWARRHPAGCVPSLKILLVSGGYEVTEDDFSIFERCMSPAQRSHLVVDLVSRQQEAIPLLEALFSGRAKNSNGVPYCRLGMPIDCGLVAAQRLGSMATSLEVYLRHHLSMNHPYAAPALGALGSLTAESVALLTAKLADENPEIAVECAYALKKCGEDQAINAASSQSPRVAAMIRSLNLSET